MIRGGPSAYRPARASTRSAGRIAALRRSTILTRLAKGRCPASWRSRPRTSSWRAAGEGDGSVRGRPAPIDRRTAGEEGRIRASRGEPIPTGRKRQDEPMVDGRQALGRRAAGVDGRPVPAAAPAGRRRRPVPEGPPAGHPGRGSGPRPVRRDRRAGRAPATALDDRQAAVDRRRPARGRRPTRAPSRSRSNRAGPGQRGTERRVARTGRSTRRNTPIPGSTGPSTRHAPAERVAGRMAMPTKRRPSRWTKRPPRSRAGPIDTVRPNPRRGHNVVAAGHHHRELQDRRRLSPTFTLRRRRQAHEPLARPRGGPRST